MSNFDRSPPGTAPPGPAPQQPVPQQPAPATEYDPARRPGAVTAAAVFAFIAAILEILAALLVLAIAVSDKRTFGPPGLAWGYVAVNLVLASLMVWGGIAALRGRTNKILVYTALALAATTDSPNGTGCRKALRISHRYDPRLATCPPRRHEPDDGEKSGVLHRAGRHHHGAPDCPDRRRCACRHRHRGRHLSRDQQQA